MSDTCVIISEWNYDDLSHCEIFDALIKWRISRCYAEIQETNNELYKNFFSEMCRLRKNVLNFNKYLFE